MHRLVSGEERGVALRCFLGCLVVCLSAGGNVVAQVAKGERSDSVAVCSECPSVSGSASSWYIGFSASRGLAIVAKERMLPLLEEVPWSVSVSVGRDALPTSRWASHLGFPALSFSYRFIRLGSDRALGYAHCLYPAYRFYFLRRPWLRISSNVGVGLGFIPKHYTQDALGYNSGVGSLVNVYIEAQLALSWRMAGGTAVGVAGDYVHMSNGGIQMPNSGLNYLFLTLSVSQVMCPVREYQPRWPASLPLHHSLTLDAAGSIVERGLPNGKKYPLYSLAVSYFYEVAPWVTIGVLGDVYWDFSLQRESAAGNLPRQPIWKMPTVSVFAGVRLHLGRLMPEVMLGYNVYQTLSEDPRFAIRLGLRYKVTPWCQPFVSMVSKKVRANHIAFGIGVDLVEVFSASSKGDGRY